MESSEADGDAAFYPNLWRVLRLLRTSWHLILLHIIVMVLMRWSSMLENVFGGDVVDTFQVGDYPKFAWKCALLAASYVTFVTCLALERVIREVIARRLNRNFKMMLFEALLLKKPQAFFDAASSGDLGSRLSSDCSNVGNTMSCFPATFLSQIFELGFSLYFLLTTNYQMCIVLAFFAPLSYLGTWLQTKYEMPLTEQLSKKNGEVMARVLEVITQLKTVKVFGRERTELKSFQRDLDRVDVIDRNLALVSALAAAASSLAFHVCIIVTFWLGGNAVFRGEITAGQFLAFNLFSLSLTDSASAIPELTTQLTRVFTSCERVFEILENYSEADLKTANASPSQTISSQHKSSTVHHSAGLPNSSTATEPAQLIVPPPTHKVLGHIKFHNVTFSYPTRPQVRVLNEMDLEIQPGQCAALVGASGGGKSTIVSILTRLYDISHGTVTIDGLDIMQLDPAWLRRQIGLVSQEPVLFSGTIRSNIIYGLDEEVDILDELFAGKSANSSPGQVSARNTSNYAVKSSVSQERLEEVAKMANAHDFIVALPDGYDTWVGERGSSLSAGQRQRIAIARALMRDPRILITDEATSALDNSSERIVQQALDRLMQGRTCIVIAHRLSTIRKCFPICVMGDGRVLEQGAHSSLLLNPAGHYAKLHNYEHQLKMSREIVISDVAVPSADSEDDIGDPGEATCRDSDSVAHGPVDPFLSEYSPKSRSKQVS